MSKVEEMEARGIGGSDFEATEDVREVERFLTRLHAQRLARSTVTSRFAADSRIVSTYSHNRLPEFSSPPEPSDPQRLLQPTEMRLAIGNDRNSSNRPQTTPASAGNRTRSADPGVKRQMAIDCGLKSVPVNDRKWASSSMSLPPSRMAMKDSDSSKSLGTTPIPSQVLLLAKEESVNVRKGLSGSKIRSGARTPRRDSRTQHFELVDSSIDQREGSILIPASSRAQSIRYSTPSVTGSAGNENSHYQKFKGNCKWNRSEQGLRLQKQLCNLNSTRAMKRASEMVQHRLDQMYLMSGNKLTLQNRYSIDDTEMLKLQEMTQTREDLMSDLKKIKYPYSVKSSTSHSVTDFNPRPNLSNGISQPQSQSAFITNPRKVKHQSIVHPSPASELDSARDYARKYHPAHTANKEVGTDEENDIDCYEDDVDDDEINSWNGPM